MRSHVPGHVADGALARRELPGRPRLRIETTAGSEICVNEYAARTAPASTDLAPFPSADRARSLSASGQRQPDAHRSTVRHGHTQSVSSTHAPIPPPVYRVRSQPIGLLSRSSSLTDGTKTTSHPPRADGLGRADSSPLQGKALHRSESLPAFPPPEEPSESPGVGKRRQRVSQDELASLPAGRVPLISSGHCHLPLTAFPFDSGARSCGDPRTSRSICPPPCPFRRRSGKTSRP